MKVTLHAGYALPAIRQALTASQRSAAQGTRDAWCAICTATAESTIDLTERKLNDDPVLRTASNLVSRGLPTLPSVTLERRFETFGRTRLSGDARGRLQSEFTGNQELLRLMLIALRELTAATKAKKTVPVGKERSSGKATATDSTNPDTRDKDTGNADKDTGNADKDAGNADKNPGPSGKNGAQARATQDNNSTGVVAGDAEETLRMLTSEEGREALQLLLSPVAVAQVQKALILAVMGGGLDSAASSWKLVVVERDIPCGVAGIEEFRSLLGTLFLLEGKGRLLPDITVTVLTASAFATSSLHTGEGATILQHGDPVPACDLLLDMAMLPCKESVRTNPSSGVQHRIVLRAAPHEKDPRRFHFTDVRPWKALFASPGGDVDTNVHTAVVTLLADCFRITHPERQQLLLIDQVLRHQSFLAALPAASGKTLLSHFAMLLQPGLSFSVVPLATLAVDQHDHLDEIGIDAVACVHEALSSEQRQMVLRAFRQGQHLLLLCSAELFRSEEVDALLAELRTAGTVFSQCVVEEAQCISEWSHDHRLTMQGIPAFAVERLRVEKKTILPLRLLTATASRDVIMDLRTQLSALGKKHTLDAAQCVTERMELPSWRHVRILNVENGGSDEMHVLRARQGLVSKAVREQRNTFLSLLNSASSNESDRSVTEGKSLPGVVYCPWSSGVLGVTNRYAANVSGSAVDDALKSTEGECGLFLGKDDGRSRIGRQVICDAVSSMRKFRDGDHALLLT
ncbi:MAG: hypothetical protein KFH87_03615, partial [Bacteroidetes bacterium]|nr:hypothetical protein [Bacteroidota bacterium]